MTDDRTLVVEFSPAIAMTFFSAIYRKKNGMNTSLAFYLAPFTIGTWICLASLVIIIMLLIIVLNKKLRFSSSGLSVFTVLGSVTCQGTECVYRYNGQRLLHFSLIIFGMLICYFYQSKIVSNHLVEWDQPPIRKLDDLTNSNVYYPVFLNSSASLENSNDSSYSALKKMILSDKKKHIKHTSRTKGSEFIADGQVHVQTMLCCKKLLESDPNLIILEEEFMHGGVYFAWQKNLSIAPILKRTFRRMMESGVNQRSYRKYFDVKEKSVSVESKKRQITLDIAAIPFIYITFSRLADIFDLSNMAAQMNAGFGALKNGFSMIWSTYVPNFMLVDLSAQFSPNGPDYNWVIYTKLTSERSELSAEEIGEKAKEEFITERLEKNERFFESIKRKNLKRLCDMNKKTKITTSKNQVVELKQQGNIALQLLIKLQRQDESINLKELM
ncbi:Glutamate receptor ionotropic, delta-1 [Nymphon striatum]|nr:Glutamate receptor ionotropic, delta-1 [Nymphon striatum]